MRTMRFGAAAVVLPLLFLIYSPHMNAQERYWEVLTLFGGVDATTHTAWFRYDEKRDHFIIGGETMERDLPVTPNAMKPRLTDQMDGFIAVFNGDCTELVYCSYIGGSENESVVDAVLLDDYRLLIALSSYSHDLPATGNAANRSETDRSKAVQSVRDTTHLRHPRSETRSPSRRASIHPPA